MAYISPITGKAVTKKQYIQDRYKHKATYDYRNDIKDSKPIVPLTEDQALADLDLGLFDKDMTTIGARGEDFRMNGVDYTDSNINNSFSNNNTPSPQVYDARGSAYNNSKNASNKVKSGAYKATGDGMDFQGLDVSGVEGYSTVPETSMFEDVANYDYGSLAPSWEGTKDFLASDTFANTTQAIGMAANAYQAYSNAEETKKQNQRMFDLEKGQIDKQDKLREGFQKSYRGAR